MKTIQRASGLRITLPESFLVAETPATSSGALSRRVTHSRFTGPVPLPGARASAEDALVAAFRSQDMTLVEQVEVVPDQQIFAQRQRGGASVAENETIDFALPLAADEGAVVLLEQDGMYAWHFARESATDGVKRTRSRGGAYTAESQPLTVTFSIPLSARSAPPDGSTKRSVLTDFVVGKVRAFILKFVAQVVVGHAMQYLERKVQPGLVSMEDRDPGKWQLITDPSALQLPSDRPAHVLLFIHGTFSSTVGGYGGLAATAWGEAFLQGARANYDAVLGFDHATLSDDPLENATDLLQRLLAINWTYPPRFDVVTHSRGGLVFRSLTELVLPHKNFPIQFDRVIFVGATNGGTLLAEPENWHSLIDLYTNLSVATCKLIGMMPQAKAVTVVLTELIKELGGLVKYCATTAVSERSVPGLAAMEPNGDFITRLNEEQPNQPRIAQTYYCAITSEFKPQVSGGDHEPKEMSWRLVEWLVAGFMAGLMKEANDLVVNTAAMTRVDPQLGKYIKDSLDFGSNPQVYHTNYFVRPEVINALTRWLRLVEPGPGGELLPGTKRVRPVSRRVTGFSRARGGVVGGEMPAVVDTDICLLTADTTMNEAVSIIEETHPSYVVLRRFNNGETLHYAFAAEEILQQKSAHQGTASLTSALNLHETDRSETRSTGGSMVPPEPVTRRIFSFEDLYPGSPHHGGQMGASNHGGQVGASNPYAGGAESFEVVAPTSRAVILVNGHPAGVLPAKVGLPNAEELAEQARQIVQPAADTDSIVRRRLMPTFAPQRLVPFVPGPLDHKSTDGTGSPVTAKPPVRRTRSIPRGPLPAMPTLIKPTPELPKDIPAQMATCHFRAEMEQEVVVQRPTLIGVTISREFLEEAEGTAAVDGEASIDLGQKLLIQVLPKTNFELLDEGWKKINPPQQDQPQTYYFTVKGTHEGEGEVWVAIQQRSVPLVTLSLKAMISNKEVTVKRQVTVDASALEAPATSLPLHQLFITEQRNGTETRYYYQLQLPELGELNRSISPPLHGDRQQYVTQLYQKLENRWLSNKDDVENFTAELRAIGATMFKELIPEGLQKALWEHRDKIKSIMVIAEEPFIPWELVHLQDPNSKAFGEELHFMGQMGLVRWLYDAGWPKEELLLRKGHVRYVIPQYPHPKYKLPEAEKESEFLEQHFNATKVEPTASAVRKLISHPGEFDLLHFACHGDANNDNIANSQLLMEGRLEDGGYLPEYFSATTAEVYANFEGYAPIIVLNACQAGRTGYKLTGIGGFAQAFLGKDAGAFMGTLWSVGDSPARHFTERFYTRLMAGATLAEATIAAREEARKAGDATWLAYVVYGHPNARIITS